MLSTILSLLFSMSVQAQQLNYQAQQFSGTVGVPARSTSVLPPAITASGFYYDWGQGPNGWGYCYQWNPNGYIINYNNPSPNQFCEQRNPSYFFWGAAVNGYGYCYQFTPSGLTLNNGYPMPNFYCDRVSPSYFRFVTAPNGYVNCYQFTSNGYVMNNGMPVNYGLCQ